MKQVGSGQTKTGGSGAQATTRGVQEIRGEAQAPGARLERTGARAAQKHEHFEY